MITHDQSGRGNDAETCLQAPFGAARLHTALEGKRRENAYYRLRLVAANEFHLRTALTLLRTPIKGAQRFRSRLCRIY